MQCTLYSVTFYLNTNLYVTATAICVMQSMVTLYTLQRLECHLLGLKGLVGINQIYGQGLECYCYIQP